MVILTQDNTFDFSHFSFKTYFLFSGVLKGELDDELASTIQFKPDFENGALLTVVIILWLS
jgi:hypothetical protein